MGDEGPGYSGGLAPETKEGDRQQEGIGKLLRRLASEDLPVVKVACETLAQEPRLLAGPTGLRQV